MMRTLNLTAALTLGAAVTLVLFFLMQWMLASDADPPERGERRLIGDISIPQLEVIIQRNTPRPPEPVVPEAPPDLPPAPLNAVGEGIPGQLVAPPPRIAAAEFDEGVLGPSDADFLPLVTIQPQYPARALEREIEGWCLLSFTVDETGAVVDARVLDAEPRGVFDSAALRAIARFKFNPRVVDGKEQRSEGVQYLFTFALEEE